MKLFLELKKAFWGALDRLFPDRDLRGLARNWKLLTARKILFFPRTLGPAEKRFLLLGMVLVLISGGTFFGRVYARNTIAAPQVGKTYIEGLLSEPRNINPIYAAGDGDRDVSRLIFSRLLTYDGQGLVRPDLAEKYDVSVDGKIYTVNLRQDAFFHDGKPVKADDVVFTVKAIQNPLYKSPRRANWQGVGVEKIDDYAVRFTLRSPYAPFIENLSVGILPRHLWERVNPEQAFLHELNLRPVGSGPYAFSELKQAKDGSVIRYEVGRNPRYYGEGPYLKKIVFLFFKSEPEMLAAWQKGRIDGFGPFPILIPQDVYGDTRIISIGMPRIFGLFFNEKENELLSDINLRRAMAHALNKKELAAAVPSRGAIPVDSALPLGILGVTADITTYPFDLEKSKALLEEAGWKDADGDGVREKTITKNRKKETVPLRFKLTTSDWPDLLKTASAVQAMLSAAGIEVEVEKHALAELETSVIRPRDFEILLFGQVYGYEPDPFAFWHSSQIKDPGLNIALYASKKADQILEESRRIADPQERAAKYEELQRIIAKDLPAVFLYSQIYLYALPEKMRGVDLQKISLPADRFNEINEWYIETKRVFR